MTFQALHISSIVLLFYNSAHVFYGNDAAEARCSKRTRKHINTHVSTHAHTSLLSASSAAVRLLLAAILSHLPSSHPPSPAPPCTPLCSLTPPSGACRAVSRTGTGGLRWSRQRVSNEAGTARKKALKTQTHFFTSNQAAKERGTKSPTGWRRQKWQIDTRKNEVSRLKMEGQGRADVPHTANIQRNEPFRLGDAVNWRV